jgi:hypothetical protein
LLVDSERDGLSFFGSGRLSGGDIRFIVDENLENGKVKAQVGVEWYNWYNGGETDKQKWLELINICQIERDLHEDGKERGIWIYVSSNITQIQQTRH